MAAGYTIRHAKARNCTVLVSFPDKPLVGGPQECGACTAAHYLAGKPQKVYHTVKTYHLVVDDSGRCTVSGRVFQNLVALGAIDDGESDPMARYIFEFVAQEADPPPLTLGFGDRGRKPTVTDAEGRDLTSGNRPTLQIFEDFD